MAKDLVLLRYTDSNKQRMAVVCRPKEGVKTMLEILGDDPDDADWFVDKKKSAVILSTTGTVAITDVEDLQAIVLWLTHACGWLAKHGG